MPDSEATNPDSLILDDHGNLYFTVQERGFIGKVDTGTANVTLVPVPTDKARPHGIIVAPSGILWAAELGANKLAKLEPDTGSLSEMVLPRDSSRPRRLAATSDGRIWYIDHAAGMLGFLHPASGLFKEYPLPDGAGSRPTGMAVDRYDMLWIVESGPSPNRLVGFDPVTESFGEPVTVPDSKGTERHLCYDPAGDILWLTADANTIARADLSTRR